MFLQSILPMLAPKVIRSEKSCHHHVQPSLDKAPGWTVFILQLPRRLTSLNITAFWYWLDPARQFFPPYIHDTCYGSWMLWSLQTSPVFWFLLNVSFLKYSHPYRTYHLSYFWTTCPFVRSDWELFSYLQWNWNFSYLSQLPCLLVLTAQLESYQTRWFCLEFSSLDHDSFLSD
jgi:hypothetical protein